MVWHLFKKDVRLLWAFALIVVAGQAVNGALHFVRDHFVTSLPFGYVTILYPIVVLMGMASLAVTLVHQDPLPGTAHDWLVRPVPRRDLLLAKLLFVMLLIHLPMLLLDFSEATLIGTPAREALFAASTRSVFLFCAITAPALMLGAVTASLAEAILLGAVVALGLAAVILVLSASPPYSSPRSPMGLGWVPTAVTHAGLLLVSAAIVVFQYLRRRTRTARTVAAIALLALVPLSYLPFAPSFAVQQWLSQTATDQVRIDVGLAQETRTRTPATGADAAGPGDRLSSPLQRSAIQLQLPVRIGQMPRDSILFVDRINVRLIGPGDRLRYQGVGNCIRNLSSTGTACFPSEYASVATGTYAIPVQTLILPKQVYTELKFEPLRVEVDYFLTLFTGRPQVSLGTSERLRPVAGMGLCRTSIDEDGDAVNLNCVSARTPPACMTIVLEDPRTHVHNPPLHQCGFDYSPVIRGPFEDPLVRFRIALPFSDLSHLIRFPIDAPQIQDARLLLETYTPAAHLRRQLIFPAARLSDWEAPWAKAKEATAGSPYRLAN